MKIKFRLNLGITQIMKKWKIIMTCYKKMKTAHIKNVEKTNKNRSKKTQIVSS